LFVNYIQDNPDPSLFAAEVRNCAGSTISLGIWCAKGQRIREIYATVPPETPSLGISLQWTTLASTEDVWHILDVAPNSPADLAGLLPYGDYVIGSPEVMVRGDSGLGELIEDVCHNFSFHFHTLIHYSVYSPQSFFGVFRYTQVLSFMWENTMNSKPFLQIYIRILL
jgi:hypothetical protein